MKTCKGCSVEKPLSEFYLDNRRDDSIKGNCKACCRARVQAHRERNRDAINARRRERRAAGFVSSPKRVRDRDKMREYNRRYNATDKARAARRAWQASGATKTEKFRKRQQYNAQRNRWPKDLRSRYGLTVEAYAWMLHSQDFCCAICNEALPVDVVGAKEQKRRLRPCVDHCHETGRVRGILCSGCNYNIVGALENGGDIHLIRALRYLGWDARRIPEQNASALRRAIQDLGE